MTARGRRFAVLLALLVGLATPLAVAAAPSAPGPQRYQVQTGDTITSIAAKLRVPGGWDALYRANATVVGKDPNRLTVGMQLTIPTTPPAPVAAPAAGSYVVRAGDTLSVIAERLKVPGGRDALYVTNRKVIGTDPNRLAVGMVLVPVAAAAPAAVPPAAAGPAAAADSATPATPATQAAAPVPALVADPPHGATPVVSTPPSAEIPAAPPVLPAEDRTNKVLVAALLGAAFLLFVCLLVYGWLPLRDPERGAMRDSVVFAGPAVLGEDGTDAHDLDEDEDELEMIEIVMPTQREAEEPFEIRLDAPEREHETPDRLSA